MQKFNKIIKKAAAASLAVVLAAGCVFEKEGPTATRDYENVLVQIGVNTADMQTKATEAPVATLETQVKTLRVYAYIGGVLSGYLYATDVNTQDKALLMDLKLPVSGNVTVDFVAVANETGMTAVGDNISVAVSRNENGTLTFSKNVGMTEFNKITYTLADQSFANGMPMYAVGSTSIDVDAVRAQQNTAEGHTGHFIIDEQIDITLTRSLSKVVVYAAEEGTSEKNNVKINNVKISNVISSGYLFPTTTYPTTYADEAIISNTEVTVDKKLNRADQNFSTNRKDPANFKLVTATPYYIPENNFGTPVESEDESIVYNWNTEVAGATKLTVNYTTGSGQDKDAVIYMPKVERNNFYKVLCLIKANGEMELVLNVVDWQQGTGASVSFDKEVSFEGGFKWYKGTEEQTITGDTYTFDVNAGEEVTCKFKITAPIGGTWYASLSGGDVQNYAFVENETDKISGTVGEDSQITIKTLSSNLNSGSDKPVKLTITAVNTDGKSMVVKFNTNGYYTIKQKQM